MNILGVFGTGYELKDFSWENDWIVFGILLALLAVYFVFVWALGRLRFSPEDKELDARYKKANRAEKKSLRKEAKGPTKFVFTWKHIRPTIIPIVSFVVVLSLVATPVLSTPGMMALIYTTLSGSHVTTYDSPAAKEAAAEAEKNVVTIEEEGLTLLKNDNNTLPLKEGTKINVFGSAAFGLFYGNGGSGSFQTDGRATSFPRYATKLEVALQEEGFEINQNIFNMIKNYYSSNKKTISVAESDYNIECGYNVFNYAEIVDSKDPRDFEAPVSAYNETRFTELNGKTLLEDAREYSDTALFVITRRGSEGEDMTYKDLSLSATEKAIIEMLENNFAHVIILFNVPTAIEAPMLDDAKIGAALFIGHPGLTGTTAIAEVLSGKVNPSGHLNDTWPYDIKSAPSYQSFGNDTTLSYTGGSTGKFVNYYENIYVGYRYYTTRGMVDPDYNYDEEVQYSFGHGLSYTTFDESISNFTVDESKQTISVDVEVTNTGEVTGREVIQLYTTAPYYPGGIEKAYYSLSAFCKTNDIEPNESKTYKLEFTFRDIASWSKDDGYYVLEAGEYAVSLRENAWKLAETNVDKRSNEHKFILNNDVSFMTSYETGVSYQNLFQDVEHGGNSEPITYLSRSDFAGTWTNKEDTNRVADAENFAIANGHGGPNNMQSGNDFKFTDYEIDGDIPAMGVDNGLTLRDLKDADWDDDRWEDLLDQLTETDLKNIVDQGSYQTAAISSIGKIESLDYDGPSAAFHSGTGHPSEVILACTWNTEMAKIMGESIGKEGSARGLTGWYAPGINTHRSPFGGRDFEYYSEDPLIAGLMAGYTAQGALKYGVYCYAKHFVLNDQEYNRSGVFSWCTEQALREIYARGFEIYVNMGGLGIMSAYNSIGSWWCGGSKALLTDLLREEWGFHGVVVTDYAGSSYMAVNIGIRAGNDLWLNKSSVPAEKAVKETRHDALILLRRSAKNILYACAHSNNVWELEDYQAVGIPEIKKAGDKKS